MLGIHLSPTMHVWVYGTFVCLCGGLFGGDTGSIGTITQMPQFIEHFGEMTEIMRGLVVAVILIPSAITGLLAGSLSDRISRKKTVSIGCLIFAFGMALAAGSTNLSMLIAARAIAGAGEGFFLSAATVYLTEISPKHMRGRLIVCFQMYTTGALAVGFFVCYGTSKIEGNWAWRTPMVLSMIVALTAGIGSPFLPYSPRWLVTKGRREEAILVLDKITEKEDEEERKELLAVPPVNKGRWADMFKKGVRGRTFLGTFINVFQQLSAIDLVLFFAPVIFAQAGLDPQTSSFIASGVTGILVFVTNILANFYVDRIGRRPLLIWGALGVGACHISIGSLYASGAAYKPAGQWAVIVLIELFAIIFSGTWSAIVRLYASEIQPSRTRAAASSFGQGANQLINTVVALTAPAFLVASPPAPYMLYGGCMLFAAAVCYVYMPETLGKTLENIDKTFEGSAVAVTWPSLLRASGTNLVRDAAARRPSRRRSSAHVDESTGRPTFPERYGMERLGSSAYGIKDSAIAEE